MLVFNWLTNISGKFFNVPQLQCNFLRIRELLDAESKKKILLEDETSISQASKISNGCQLVSVNFRR